MRVNENVYRQRTIKLFLAIASSQLTNALSSQGLLRFLYIDPQLSEEVIGLHT